MEAIAVLLGLTALLAVLLGPIVGLMAWITSRENRRRLEALEARSIVLESKLRRWELSAGGIPPAMPSKPVSTEKPVSAEQPASPEIPRPAAATPEISVIVPAPSAHSRVDKASVDWEAEDGVLQGEPEDQPESLGGEELHDEKKPDEKELDEEQLKPPWAALEGGDGEEPRSAGIDWERWIGLRGAAVLGGAVLALAALLFLKYSIEAGLIPPVVRVALSVFVGLGALVGSQTLRRRGYEATANGLAGGGVVILYGAIWAAQALYHLIGVAPAYLLMTLVTAVCGLLSWRHRSLVVAVLGLVGGFATPMLLTSQQHNPIGLFSYILLLDAGLLFLARRRGWPLLALLSLVVTAGYQAEWIFGHLRGDEGLLALGVLAAFAGLYAVGAAASPQDEVGSGRWPPFLGQGAAVGLAFAFALHLSSQSALTEYLVPLTALLILLSLAAQLLSRIHCLPWVPAAVAAADVAVVFNWLRVAQWGRGREWLVVGMSLGLAAAFHGASEWWRLRQQEKDKPVEEGLPGAVVAAFGLLLVTVLPVVDGTTAILWPWIVGWLGLAVLLVRQSFALSLPWTQALAAAGLGLAFSACLGQSGWSQGEASLPPWLFFGVVLAAAMGFQALGLRRRDEAGRRWANGSAALLPWMVLLGLLWTRSANLRQPTTFLGASLLLTLLMVLAVTRLRSGKAYAVAVATLAWVHFAWTSTLYRFDPGSESLGLALGLQALAVVFLTLWPLFAGRAFVGQRWAWIGSALAGPLWFFSLRDLFEKVFGDGFIGVLPLALGGLSLFGAFQSRKLLAEDDRFRKGTLVWFAAVALGFVSLAIPLQLDKEWVTIAWALEGLATLALWKRLDYPGLKYFSLGLLAAVSVRLVANPAILGYHAASGVLLFNWLTYSYLIPASCLLGAAYFLFGREVERQRPWEESLYRQGRPVAAGLCGLAAILVTFVWINLSIVDFFSGGGQLTFSLERSAALDLTTSLAWGVYAVVLLAVGIARGWVALRWLSLAFLVLTIGKVFLFDLGELRDLYRVASLVGLAVSLILVSLVYQRFVFRREPSGNGFQRKGDDVETS